MVSTIRWREPVPIDAPSDLFAAVGGHPLVTKSLLRRGIDTVEKANAFLDAGCYVPTHYNELPDLERAVDRLVVGIRRNELIGVWGDFDADGQTATTVLVEALRLVGGRVKWYIPVRSRESHGLSSAGVERFIQEEKVQLLLTCDTGVSDFDAVVTANNNNVDVIITDHHTLPQDLPPAYAIVNPQRLPETHALFPLSGVGCAFKLVEGLLTRMGQTQDADRFLDLVALGTVADVAYLVKDNRYLVQRGLARLRKTERVGLDILINNASIDQANLSEEHIGFALAPRLNALGRLGDANPIVEFLSTPDETRARLTASQLEALNGKRRLLCDQVYQAAQTQIENDNSLLDYPVLVLNHPEWPAGVVGIVASRLVDLYHRPVLLIASPNDEPARGSARSVEGINITKALSANKELLLGFGGHPMAAGISIDPQNISKLRRALGRTVENIIDWQPIIRNIPIDAYLPLGDINLELVEELNRLAPFGAGNPPLVFATRNVSITSSRKIGRSDDHLRLVIEDETGSGCTVLWWNGAASQLPEGRFDIAYTLHASNYRGKRQVQVEWIDARVIDETALVSGVKPALQIVDYRHEAEPETLLKKLAAEDGVVFWQEGEMNFKINGKDSSQIMPAKSLVLLTVPSGRQEMMSVIRSVSPQVLYIFGIRASDDKPYPFLKQLAGLTKYAMRSHDGWVDQWKLAAITAQREKTVRDGLSWLAAHGDIREYHEGRDRLRIVEGGDLDPQRLQDIENSLKALLEETAAFRRQFLKADIGWFTKIVEEI